MNPAFRIQDLQVAFGGTPVLHHVTLDIPQARTTAIVGPNGSGKSTLLRALARLQSRKGSILRGGADIARVSPREYARQVALLPQAPEAPENLTTIDLVARGRDPHRRWYDQWSREEERIVRDALETTGVTELADRPIGTLSGGQRQRAWIALALAQSPEALLLDEPTTYLDVAHQLDVLETVTDLQRRRGITVVMVLHDLGMAARYADDVIVMSEGSVAAHGEPAETLTPAVLREVFRVDCRILVDPVTGRPVIVPHRLRATTEGR